MYKNVLSFKFIFYYIDKVSSNNILFNVIPVYKF